MVPSELWMLGHFSDGFHFVFVPFSYQDLYVRSIIQMPHAKYQMWPLSDFCHEIQNKYKHGRYTLCSGNNVVTKSWEKSSDNKCLLGTGTGIHAPLEKLKNRLDFITYILISKIYPKCMFLRLALPNNIFADQRLTWSILSHRKRI